MSEQIVYQFEEIAEDLTRPPMAAQRALLQTGFIISPKGWQSLAIEMRRHVAAEGSRDIVDRSTVQRFVERVPPKFVKLVSRSSDPDPERPPAALNHALGPARPIADGEWRLLRSLDRYVLSSLVANTRLLCRAYDEMAHRMGKGEQKIRDRWSGSIASCKMRIRGSAIMELSSPRFLDGQAFVLARVAGIRAARAVSQTLDLHADTAPGPVELDYAASPNEKLVLWQAHVSSWDGNFFPAAALLAATTAAAALYDMAKDLDPSASLSSAGIREDAWRVGSHATVEEATVIYASGARQAPEASPEMPRAVSIEHEQAAANHVGKRAAAEIEAHGRIASPSGPSPVSRSGQDWQPVSEPTPGGSGAQQSSSQRVAMALLLVALSIFVLSLAIFTYVLMSA